MREHHRLTRRLLVVAMREAGMPGSPGMPGKRVKVAENWELAVGTVVVRGLLHQQLDHSAPLARPGPRRIMLSHHRGREDVVAIVEVVIVELRVGAI